LEKISEYQTVGTIRKTQRLRYLVYGELYFEQESKKLTAFNQALKNRIEL